MIVLIAAVIISVIAQNNAFAKATPLPMEPSLLFNFDFSQPSSAYSGIGLAGAMESEPSQTWNRLANDKKKSSGSLGTIYASNGVLIPGASVSWTSSGDTFNSNPTDFNSTDYKKLMDYYDFASGSKPQTITLSGIPNGNYILYVYSQDEKTTGKPDIDSNGNHHGGVQTLNISVAGQTGSATSDPNATTFTENKNYIKINNITMSGNQLVINYSSGSPTAGGLGVINGFQLLDPPASPGAVPEPSSIAYIGIGAALAGFVRMRNRRNAA